ncbi:MAG: MFS transporter [Anaerolineae bacterium]
MSTTTTTPDIAIPESVRYRHLRWNFPMFLLDYLIFGITYNLFSPTVVVPEFISNLTTDPRIIGLAGTLSTLCWLAPQLLFSQMITRRSKRRPFLRAALPFRTLIPLMALVIALAGNTNPGVILVTFLVCYGLFWIGDGLVTVAWADMLGSTLTPKARATLFGFGQFGVAIGAIFSREVVRKLLAPDAPPFPHNYALLFGIAGTCFIIAALALVSVREEEDAVTVPSGPTLRQFLPYIFTVLRDDRRFRYFTIVRLLLDFVTMALPFYIIFGSDVLKVESSNLVGDSILLITFGSASASLLNSQISRHFGPRAVVWLIAVAKVAMASLSLISVSSGNLTALHACFFMLGAINGSTGAGIFDYVITYAPADRRPIYMGLTNTISAIGNAAPIIGGFILNQTQSYPVLFTTTLIIAIVGALLSLRLADPRQSTALQVQDQVQEAIA